MHGDIEFLQGAFESYKSQLHMEMDERWRKRETELKDQQDDMLHDKLKELRMLWNNFNKITCSYIFIFIFF